MIENNNNFTEYKIITDLRLIFDDENITNSRRNAVVLHNLHIGVSNPSNEEDIYIHLDAQDLRKLKEAIEKAILKEDLIKADYENIDFINIE